MTTGAISAGFIRFVYSRVFEIFTKASPMIGISRCREWGIDYVDFIPYNGVRAWRQKGGDLGMSNKLFLEVKIYGVSSTHLFHSLSVLFWSKYSICNVPNRTVIKNVSIRLDCMQRKLLRNKDIKKLIWT